MQTDIIRSDLMLAITLSAKGKDVHVLTNKLRKPTNVKKIN